MKRVVLMGIFVGLCASIASAQGAEGAPTSVVEQSQTKDADDGYGPPWACPVYPIMVMPEGTMYYCNRHQTDNCANPTSCYLIGDYDWPRSCPNDVCETATYKDGDEKPGRNPSIMFKGLNEPVPVEYMHRHLRDDAHAPGQEEDKSCFPGGPTRRFFSVSEHSSLKFIEVHPFKDGELRVLAKVLKVEVDEGLASGGASNKVETFVAFEVDRAPQGGWTQIPDVNVTPAWARESHAYNVKWTLDNREINILLLLAKHAP
jgi:hypothetical protein